MNADSLNDIEPQKFILLNLKRTDNNFNILLLLLIMSLDINVMDIYTGTVFPLCHVSSNISCIHLLECFDFILLCS